MDKFKVISYPKVKSEHLGRHGCLGANERRLVSEEDGAEHFHVRVIEILPSGFIPPHQHEHEHCAIMLEGKCVVVCGGKEKTAEEDSVIFIPANVMHSWHNKTSKYAVFFLVDA